MIDPNKQEVSTPRVVRAWQTKNKHDNMILVSESEKSDAMFIGPRTIGLLLCVTKIPWSRRSNKLEWLMPFLYKYLFDGDDDE